MHASLAQCLTIRTCPGTCHGSQSSTAPCAKVFLFEKPLTVPSLSSKRHKEGQQLLMARCLPKNGGSRYSFLGTKMHVQSLKITSRASDVSTCGHCGSTSAGSYQTIQASSLPYLSQPGPAMVPCPAALLSCSTFPGVIPWPSIPSQDYAHAYWHASPLPGAHELHTSW